MRSLRTFHNLSKHTKKFFTTREQFEANELINKLRSNKLTRHDVEDIIQRKKDAETELRRMAPFSAGMHGQADLGPHTAHPSAHPHQPYIPPGSPYHTHHHPPPHVTAPQGAPAPPTHPFAGPGFDKATPLYIERVGEKRVLNLLMTMAFWAALIGVYVYFQRRNSNLGGLMDDNYSEYDEISWEDDEDEDAEGKTGDAALKNSQHDDDPPDEYERRRREWLQKIGIHTNDHYASDSDKNSTRQKQKRVTFEDVCGCHEAKTDLQDLVHYLKNPEKFREMGVKLPKGVLLEGQPGTGKTLMARALAGEAKVPFLSTNGSSFDQIFVGIGVMRIKNLFNRAKELAPCIIFIDEIDAIGSTRSSVSMSPHSSDSLNALLVEMDGFEDNNGVIVLAATNMAERLDNALVRAGRFDRKIKVGLPDRKTRTKIVDLYLKDRGDETVTEQAIDLLVSNLAGMSGADLANIVNLAGIDAVKEGCSKITFSHLNEAKETVAMGRAHNSMVVSKEAKRVTAFHEGGHAIVGLFTQGANPIHKATLLPRGNALGMVWHGPKDEHSQTKEQLLASLDVAMGGRAAEELIFGLENVTTGASSDFNQATQMASRMVCQYGMSPKVGKVFYRHEDVEKLSPSLQDLINEETRRLLDEGFERATATLNARKEELDLLAEALLERETLTVEEIKEAIGWKSENVLKPKDNFKREDERSGKGGKGNSPKTKTSFNIDFTHLTPKTPTTPDVVL